MAFVTNGLSKKVFSFIHSSLNGTYLTVQFIFKFFIVTFTLPVLPKIKQNKFVTFRERKKQGKQFSKLYFYLSPTEHKKATIYCTYVPIFQPKADS